MSAGSTDKPSAYKVFVGLDANPEGSANEEASPQGSSNKEARPEGSANGEEETGSTEDFKSTQKEAEFSLKLQLIALCLKLLCLCRAAVGLESAVPGAADEAEAGTPTQNTERNVQFS